MVCPVPLHPREVMLMRTEGARCPGALQGTGTPPARLGGLWNQLLIGVSISRGAFRGSPILASLLPSVLAGKHKLPPLLPPGSMARWPRAVGNWGVKAQAERPRVQGHAGGIRRRAGGG